jgi:hypothetical protein
MGRLGWSSSLRVLALLLTAFWFAAAVLQMVLSFNLTGPPPPPQATVQDDLMAQFGFQHGRWGIDFASQVLFGLGFLSLAGVGILISRLADADDARRALSPGIFLTAGILGTASSLVWIGVVPVATFPHYCPCDLRDAELAARIMILNTAGSVAVWLTIGAIVVASLGLVMIVALAVEAGMPRGWSALTYLTAVAGVVAAVIGALPAFTTIDLGPLPNIAPALVAGILVPIWALWLAMRAPELSTEPMDDDARPMMATDGGEGL